MPQMDQVDWFRRLDEELRAPGDDRLLVMEVAVSAEGSQQSAHSFELSSISPCSVVLDPDYRYPNHPLPGMPRPVGTEPSARPTDPGVLRHIEGLVGEFTGHYRRIKGRDPGFGQVSTEEELAAAEQEMGLRLPEDVRALHLLVGDDLHEIGLLGRYSLYSLRQVVDRYIERGPGCWGWEDGLFRLGRVVFEAYPFDAVRRVSRNDWWVVIGSDFGGNECAVDLDPGPGGTSGQVIAYGRDFHGPVGLEAGSVTEQLTAVVEALRRGDLDPDYEDEDYIGAELPAATVPYHVASQRIGPRDLATVLPEHSDTVQQLYLNDAESLDLRALSATPHVRELSINRAGTVRLWLPPQLEALALEATQADLSIVEGHQALWDLELKGFPVSVDHLAALPALARLDVSGASVDNVEALADLDIRVLILSGEQWQRLRAAGRLPKRLAGATWAGHTMLDEATDWATWIRSHVPG